MGDYVCQQCSGVPPEADQVSATEFDPLSRSRSLNGLSFTGVGLQLQPNQYSKGKGPWLHFAGHQGYDNFHGRTQGKSL